MERDDYERISQRIQWLENREQRHADRVEALQMSLTNLTSELHTVTEALNKMRTILYIVVATAILTSAPELGQAVPLILKMAG